jgi:hypothetical protein
MKKQFPRMAAQALPGKQDVPVRAEYLQMKMEKAAVVRQPLKCLRQEPVRHEAVLQEDHAMAVMLLRKNHLQNVLPAEVAPMAGEVHAKKKSY